MAAELTGPPEPVGLYEPFTRHADLLFLSAIGCATLPNNTAVTLEAIARIAT